jgi:hypothetical protein
MAVLTLLAIPRLAFFDEHSADFSLEDMDTLTELLLNREVVRIRDLLIARKLARARKPQLPVDAGASEVDAANDKALTLFVRTGHIAWSRGDLLSVVATLIERRKAFDDDESGRVADPCPPCTFRLKEIADMQAATPGAYITRTRAIRMLACARWWADEYRDAPIAVYADVVAERRRLQVPGARHDPYRVGLETLARKSLELAGVIGSITPVASYLVFMDSCTPRFSTLTRNEQLLELRLVYWLIVHLSGPRLALALAPHTLTNVRDLQIAHGADLSACEVRTLMVAYAETDCTAMLVDLHREQMRDDPEDDDESEDEDDESCRQMARLSVGAPLQLQPVDAGALGERTWDDLVVACVLSLMSDFDNTLLDTMQSAELRAYILRMYAMDDESLEMDAALTSFAPQNPVVADAIDRFVRTDAWFNSGASEQCSRLRRVLPFIVHLLSQPCEMELLRIVELLGESAPAPAPRDAELLPLAIELHATLHKMKDEFDSCVGIDGEQAQADLRTRSILGVMRALFSDDEPTDAAIRMSLFIPDGWTVQRAADRFSELYQEVDGDVGALERALQWDKQSSFGVKREAHCFTHQAIALITFMRLRLRLVPSGAGAFGVARLLAVPYAASATDTHKGEAGPMLNQLTPAQVNKKLVRLANSA